MGVFMIAVFKAKKSGKICVACGAFSRITGRFIPITYDYDIIGHFVKRGEIKRVREEFSSEDDSIICRYYKIIDGDLILA